MTPETDLILRALDDVRDDLAAYRRETREELTVVFRQLDETRQLVARLDERTKRDFVETVPPPSSRRERVNAVVKRAAPAAGAGALVAALVELVPVIVKAIGGG